MLQLDLEKNGIVRSTVEGVAEKSSRNSGKLIHSRKRDRKSTQHGKRGSFVWRSRLKLGH